MSAPRMSARAKETKVGILLCKHKKDYKLVVWVDTEEENDKFSLSYYHYYDDLGFYHTVSLLRALPQPLSVIHVALQSKKKKAAADDSTDPALQRLMEILEGSLKSNQESSSDDENFQDAANETLIQSHSYNAKADLGKLQSVVQQLLVSDSAWLHFQGDKHWQQEPDIANSLVFFLQCISEYPDAEPNVCTSIGAGTLLSTFLRLDQTAADAMHVWPPANAAQQYEIGGNAHTNSIYGVLSQPCQTAAGKSLMKDWLRQPVVDLNELTARHDAVEALVQQSATRDAIRSDALRLFNVDLHTLAQTLSQAENIAVRKSLAALYNLYLVAAQKLPLLNEHLANLQVGGMLAEMIENFAVIEHDMKKSIELVEQVLDMNQAPREFVIQVIYQDELRDIRKELDDLQEQLDTIHEKMNQDWAQATGKSDAVRLERVEEDRWQFRLLNTNDSKLLQQQFNVQIHRLLKNGVYFSNSELQKISTQMADLNAEYDKHQQQVVRDALSVASSYAPILERAHANIRILDVLCAFAHTAAHQNYCRPELFDTNVPVLELKAARHPCVELQENVDFIPNDCILNAESSFLMVTGPNMGGKSTYIRSLGAIVTMAQIGSFVPCESAKFNICHHILARVGAGDLQERGISTFMAEMLESSLILKTATRRSLIIIDELGRGTSTFDGYGLARAISEYILQKIGCLTVFATHFHELTALPVQNAHVTAQATSSSGLTFLYEVRPGPCLESFGIAVAEMANVPAVVIEDAKRRARQLERSNDDLVERFRKLPKEALTAQYASDAEKKQALLTLLGQ